MQTVEIWSGNIHTGEGHSSKGNQLKWQEDGWWYKADAFGYESLAETVSSQILQFSNIETAVLYEPVMIQYHGKTFRGCRSKNFRGGQEELVTLERLYRAYTGFSLARELAHFADTGRKIQHVDEFVGNVTGLEEFGKYLTVMLEIDAFFLNEDRHMHNIAVLWNGADKYDYCPIFDQGASLLSDTVMDYPMEQDVIELMPKVRAKTFCGSFEEQLDIAEDLYGETLHFTFKEAEIKDLLKKDDIYPENIKERVYTILLQQRRKYQWLFR